jgi:hypothetical protein
MTSDITLRKMGDPDPNSLPPGVRVIVLSDDIVFVRRIGGRFVPLSEKEQQQLKNKHVQ